MPDISLIHDLSLIFLTALFVGYIANRLGQQIMIAYLVCGLLIGPYGAKIISNVKTTSTLAEAGVALLLFTIGVELSFRELERIKNISLWGTILQILLIIIIVTGIGHLIGLSLITSLYLGSIIAISSTVIVMKALAGIGQTNTLHGKISLGMLIVQDLAVIFIIAILSIISISGNILSLFSQILKAFILLFVTYFLARKIVPFIFVKIAETKSKELFILVNLAVCFGMAIISKLLGLSMEIGAFIGGLAVSESRLNYQTLSQIIPLRDIFIILFFTSIGMMINPYLVFQNIPLTLFILFFVVFVKFFVFVFVVLLFRYNAKTSILVAASMVNIGEFSFLIASLGKKVGVLQDELFSAILVSAFLSILITPISIKLAPLWLKIISKIKPLNDFLNRFDYKIEDSRGKEISGHVIICGFGRVGRNVGNILQKYGIPYIVIDHDIRIINDLLEKNIPAIYGDASSEEVLHHANPKNAHLMVIALPDFTSTQISIRHALKYNPNLPIIARAHYEHEIDKLYSAGAEDVIQPEFEGSLETIRHVLARLGFENIECELQNIRRGRYKLLYESELTKVCETK